MLDQLAFTDKTDIKVKTIDMVTTAMVLEAARKTALIDSDLELVYHELNWTRLINELRCKLIA